MKIQNPISFTLPTARHRATGLPLCLMWVFFMEKKKCNDCGEIKELKEFNKRKIAKDGYRNNCTECYNKWNDEYRKTKIGLISNIYGRQRSKSKQRGHKLPNYTNKELQAWCFSQDLFHELHNKWVLSGYDKNLIPSIDRLDDYSPYTLENIQLMTWNENNQKAYLDRKNGINNKVSKAVLQFDLEGNFIKEYYSVHEASRKTGINRGNICEHCRGNTFKTVGGYIWKYKNPQKDE